MNPAQPRPVVPARYIEALGDAEPIEALRKAPKRVKKLVRDMSEKQLAKRPAEGKWSLKEIIAHLADGEVVLGARIRFVAAMDRPPIPGYDQDLFVERLGIERVKTKSLLDAFAAARALNVALLERLPDEALDRIGLHAERGEESIQTMVTMYAGHDFIHEAQIENVKVALQESKSEKKARKKLEEEREQQEEKLLKAAKKARKEAERQTGEIVPDKQPRKKLKKKQRKGGTSPVTV